MSHRRENIARVLTGWRVAINTLSPIWSRAASPANPSYECYDRPFSLVSR
ncbi:MAG: hypothetical protein ACOX7C_07165 [Brevefilum sp.]